MMYPHQLILFSSRSSIFMNVTVLAQEVDRDVFQLSYFYFSTVCKSSSTQILRCNLLSFSDEKHEKKTAI